MYNGVRVNYAPTERQKQTGEGGSVQYHFKPTETLRAKFEGDKARCGNCNSLLGEFEHVSGKIKCRKNDCKVLNTVNK